jgi:hypothetical protein
MFRLQCDRDDPFNVWQSLNICAQKYSYNGNRGVLYVVCAKELKRRQLGQSSSADRSSVWDLSTEAGE